MLGVAERHAGALGAHVLHAGIKDDQRGGLAWADHRQYVVVHHHLESALDLADVPWHLWDAVEADLSAQGARVAPLAAISQTTDQSRVFALVREAEQDLPDPPTVPLSDDDLRVRWYAASAAWPETGAAILGSGGEPWAVSANERLGALGNPVTVEFTAVARERRMRGLGLAVKLAALALVRDAGIVRVTTSHHASNAPMLAVNRRLGFTPLTGSVYVDKWLGGCW